eukprot:6658993-Pyramimonas_sp.AAC.1
MYHNKTVAFRLVHRTICENMPMLTASAWSMCYSPDETHTHTRASRMGPWLCAQSSLMNQAASLAQQMLSPPADADRYDHVDHYVHHLPGVCGLLPGEDKLLFAVTEVSPEPFGQCDVPFPYGTTRSPLDSSSQQFLDTNLGNVEHSKWLQVNEIK